MSHYIGIDLGTTFSAVAVFAKTGAPKILRDAEGHAITPSCVEYNGEEVFVGRGPEAKYQGGTSGVAARFKREMGNAEARYEMAGKTFTPKDLSAAVLDRMRSIAERQLGEVAQAVITIPANFMHEARNDTLAAAQIAGLEVSHIINEPTAAALYYATEKGAELSGTYAVYDLGGGTFDVSLLRVEGNDIEVVATEGVAKLGGDDFDLALKELFRRKYTEANGSEPPAGALDHQAIVDAKHKLSKRPKALVDIDGEPVQVTREEFEEVLSPYLSQTELLCESVLEEAGLAAADLAGIFLAGGSTRIPMVQRTVARVFGQEPVVSDLVDEVVALGAAIYAGLKSDGEHLSAVQKQSISSIRMVDVATYYYGTLSLSRNEARDTTELQNTILIRKGVRVPCTEKRSFATIGDDQRSVNCRVTLCKEEETDPRFAKVVWEGDLELPPGRPAGQPIEVAYTLNENGMMECSFLDVQSGHRKEVTDLLVGAEDTDDSAIKKFLVD